MAIFVNTRPTANKLPCVASLASIHHVPLIHLSPRVLSDTEHAHQADLLQGKYDVLVVVSPTAIAHAKRTLSITDQAKLCWLVDTGKLTVVAVGYATATALAKMGIVAQTPPIASNESMMGMAVFESAKQVLFWRGVDGRTLLANHLMAQGTTVDCVNWYTRAPVCPDVLASQLPPVFDQPIFDQPILVLITSQTAWQAWCDMLARHPTHARFVYIAMGDRLQAMTGGVVVYELSDHALCLAVGKILGR